MRVNPPFNHPGRQSGAVLLVAVLLLLLAGVMTVFAMNVGLFEQRSTGNDLRAKAVNEVAEAGLAQGFEYLMRQHPEMLEDAGLWQKCTATDISFPCGAISAAPIDTDGDGTADTARRATMYRLHATSHTIPGLDNALANYMLELEDTSKIDTAANGASVSYGVAPVVCFMARPATSVANLEYEKPLDTMEQMLKSRHLAPLYGERTPVAPEAVRPVALARAGRSLPVMRTPALA